MLGEPDTAHTVTWITDITVTYTVEVNYDGEPDGDLDDAIARAVGRPSDLDLAGGLEFYVNSPGEVLALVRRLKDSGLPRLHGVGDDDED